MESVRCLIVLYSKSTYCTQQFIITLLYLYQVDRTFKFCDCEAINFCVFVDQRHGCRRHNSLFTPDAIFMQRFSKQRNAMKPYRHSSCRNKSSRFRRNTEFGMHVQSEHPLKRDIVL